LLASGLLSGDCAADPDNPRFQMRRLVPFIAAALLAYPAAADLENMTADERAAFREEVRAYLMENPEVLMEAIGVLEARQAEEQLAADEDLVGEHSAALFDDGTSWVGGNLEGDVVVVEFLDYRCGYCRRAHPEINDLVETDGGIRYVV
jgi:protein-disulfide isomerase